MSESSGACVCLVKGARRAWGAYAFSWALCGAGFLDGSFFISAIFSEVLAQRSRKCPRHFVSPARKGAAARGATPVPSKVPQPLPRTSHTTTSPRNHTSVCSFSRKKTFFVKTRQTFSNRNENFWSENFHETEMRMYGDDPRDGLVSVPEPLVVHHARSPPVPPDYNVARRPQVGVELAKLLANRRLPCAATFSTL